MNLTSNPESKFSWRKLLPYGIYLMLGFLVTFPLFRHGYVFLLDMVFPPDMGLPAVVHGIVPSNYPLRAILYVLAQIIGTPLTEKLLLLFLLALPGGAMYKLGSKYWSCWGAFLAGVLYMINPWVYERFLAGHWLVMLGYGFLPLFIYTITNVLENPKRSHILKFAAVVALYPILSQHFAYIAFGFGIIYATIWVIYHKLEFTRARWRHIGIVLGTVFILMALVNSFWLYGALEKKDSAYQQIRTSDFETFTTKSDPKLGPYVNTLALYGFWSVDDTLPKDHNPLWWLIPVIFITMSGFGVYKGCRERNVLALALGILFIPVTIVAVGYGSEFSKHIVEFLVRIIPGFKGLRETEKLSGLLALSYAYLVPMGAMYISGKYFNKGAAKISGGIYGGIIFFAMLSVYRMVGGYSGDVTAHDYPKGWYEAQTYLAHDISLQTSEGHVLVLPWHEYLRISFADYRRVANPAITFFDDVPLYFSRDTENVYLDEVTNPMRDLVTMLVQKTSTIDASLPYLKSEQIRYIMLIKESDWERYQFFEGNAHAVLVLDTPSISLYQIVE